MSTNQKIILILLFLLSFLLPILGLITIFFVWKWPQRSKVVKGLVTIFYLFTLVLIPPSLLVYTYNNLIRPYQVVGNAMNPTYKDGAYVLSKIVSKKDTIVRGSVVILTPPTQKDTVIIKRIVGLPGEDIKLSEGKVYIDDSPLDESDYLSTNAGTYGQPFLPDDQSMTIPPDSYFVMGDNRQHGYDSRSFGFVPKSNIIAVVELCYWKCN